MNGDQFFGFSRGYGTWFQGEEAANYAGPFGTDADVHYLGVKGNPTERLTVGGSTLPLQRPPLCPKYP